MNEPQRDGIQLLSDLYLHCGNPLPWLEEDAGIVIVAENLAPIQQPRCLRAAAAQWGKAKVLYVPGPVELHGNEIDEARATLAEECQRVGVTLLDPGAVMIGGVRFIGATLWTDFKLCGSAREPAAHRAAEQRTTSEAEARSTTGQGILRSRQQRDATGRTGGSSSTNSPWRTATGWKRC